MGIAEALPNDASIIGDCDLRILQLRMPDFFPFEAVEALVSDGLQCLDLALDWNIATPGENILTIFSAADRVL